MSDIKDLGDSKVTYSKTFGTSTIACLKQMN